MTKNDIKILILLEVWVSQRLSKNINVIFHPKNKEKINYIDIIIIVYFKLYFKFIYSYIHLFKLYLLIMKLI